MLFTVKNCCRILWKHPTLYHHRRAHTMLLPLGLCLLLCSAAVAGDPVKNRRSQRRFMWAHSMDGFMGSMASGARAMKNMFTDLMPTMQSTALPGHMHGNILDYLPSETTRIKYIIRSPPPNSKPVKIIKIHSPKKYIKIMAPMKSSSAHEPKNTHTKPSKMHFPSAEQMRKLEKQQELIAEGRAPTPTQPKDEFHAAPAYKPNYETYKQPPHGGAEGNDIVSGKIHYGDGWKPVHDELIRQPNAYHETVKSYPMSELHTNIAHAELPNAEKAMYEHAAEHENDNDEEDLDDVDDDDFEDHDPLQQPNIESDEEETRHAQHYQPPSHTYEVTENTGEETVARPQTQEHPHAARGFFPARGTMPSSSAATSTTEEPPNYPASFLRRQREQQRSTQSPPPPQPLALARFKHRDASMPSADSSWTPSTNSSYSGFRSRPSTVAAAPIQHHQHQSQPNHQQHTKVRQKSEKWPPEMPPPRPFVAMAMTDTAVAFEATTTTSAPSGGRTTRKNVKFRPTTAPATSAGAAAAAGRPTFRDIKLRGSVKFGDKL